MNPWRFFGLLLLATAAMLSAAEDALDRVEETLTWSGANAEWRGRLSGLFDAEGYALPHPALGVIDADGHRLFNPRLTLYLDAQLGNRWYVFGQGRIDRGFDPASDPLEARVDELAVRWAQPDAALNFQAGKFATVVGNWTSRHDSWSNPFITAPIPYDHLTAVWDNEPAQSATQLLVWSHLRPGLPRAVIEQEKYLRVPIIWGPSYTTGLAVAGQWEKFRYACELKSASLSSRPDAWLPGETRWDHPTVSGRIRYAPSQEWEFGWSASAGTFLRPIAEPLLTASHGRGAYRQLVLGQDVAYAWHHVQVWAELYAARFELPLVGNADTLAGYIEAKYKFTPRFFGAVRWNQQFFGTIVERGTAVQWEHNLWQLDVAPTFRLTPHFQLKVQGTIERGSADDGRLQTLVAAQATMRF